MFDESTESMMKEDERILSEGKITWGSRFDALNREVERYRQLASLPEDFYDTEEKLKNPNYKKNGTREYWAEQQKEAEKALSQFMVASSNIDSEAIEKIANEIKTWDKTWDEDEFEFNPFDHSLPWKDIALSMLTYPQPVELQYDRCPKCGNRRVKLYFNSPSWTWAHLCGRAGEMKICLECREQDFDCKVLS